MIKETDKPYRPFDFEKIGKRMPYTIPDDSFAQMEQHVWETIKREQRVENMETCLSSPTRKHFSILPHWKTLSAIAAVIALVVTVGFHLAQSSEVDIEEVEQAFCSLSADDQEYLLASYQNDVFLYE